MAKGEVFFAYRHSSSTDSPYPEGPDTERPANLTTLVDVYTQNFHFPQ